MSEVNILSGFMIGALVGFVLAQLTAEENGAVTRQNIMEEADELALALLEEHGITTKD